MDQKRFQVTCRKIVLRWSRNLLTRGFAGWLDHIRRSIRIRIICEKTIWRWRSLLLSIAMQAWAEEAKHSVWLMRIGLKAGLRWLMLTAAGAFRTWCENVQEGLRTSDFKARVAMRWMSLDKAKCFKTWCANVYAQRKVTRICSRAVRRMHQVLQPIDTSDRRPFARPQMLDEIRNYSSFEANPCLHNVFTSNFMAGSNGESLWLFPRGSAYAEALCRGKTGPRMPLC